MHLTYGSVQCNSPPEEATPPVIREEAISGADQTMLEDLRTQVLVLQQQVRKRLTTEKHTIDYCYLFSVKTGIWNRLKLYKTLVKDWFTSKKWKCANAQVKIYREDFETERRDRERSQNEKQRLDEMLTQAQHEVEALTQQVRTHEFDFQQEKREKERLKRHLQRVSRKKTWLTFNNNLATCFYKLLISLLSISLHPVSLPLAHVTEQGQATHSQQDDHVTRLIISLTGTSAPLIKLYKRSKNKFKNLTRKKSLF